MTQRGARPTQLPKHPPVHALPHPQPPSIEECAALRPLRTDHPPPASRTKRSRRGKRRRAAGRVDTGGRSGMAGCGGGLPQRVVLRPPRRLPLPHRQGQRFHPFPYGSASLPPPDTPPPDPFSDVGVSFPTPGASLPPASSTCAHEACDRQAPPQRPPQPPGRDRRRRSPMGVGEGRRVRAAQPPVCSVLFSPPRARRDSPPKGAFSRPLPRRRPRRSQSANAPGRARPSARAGARRDPRSEPQRQRVGTARPRHRSYLTAYPGRGVQAGEGRACMKSGPQPGGARRGRGKDGNPLHDPVDGRQPPTLPRLCPFLPPAARTPSYLQLEMIECQCGDHPMIGWGACVGAGSRK